MKGFEKFLVAAVNASLIACIVLQTRALMGINKEVKKINLRADGPTEAQAAENLAQAKKLMEGLVPGGKLF
jgi:hypothetical protein